MSKFENTSWDGVLELTSRVLEKGEPLALTEEVCTLLRSAAPTVAISEVEAEAALANVESATALLREIDKRIRDGSRRLSKAQSRMYRLRDAEEIEGARQQMRDVLAVEVVPHYRHIAESQLEELSAYDRQVDLSATELHDIWNEAQKLHYQVNKKGWALQLTDSLRDFLRRAAATVALSEAEIEEALGSEQSAAALLRELRKRVLEGSRRIEKAIYRMYGLREMGDLAGARQQMHDVLAVEVVPFFREWAERELGHLDEFEKSRGQQ